MELPLTSIDDIVGSGFCVGNWISNWIGSLLYILLTISSGVPENRIFPTKVWKGVKSPGN